jgi:autophagy-related protein 16
MVQILHDEIATLQLELEQVEKRNQNLGKDNATLLQRWLDAKQTEANRMNEANDFYEDMRTKHQAVLTWRDGSVNGGADSRSTSQLSGNGSEAGDEAKAGTKNGTTSLQDKGVSLTPNG